MNFIAWLIVGGSIGWLASMLMGTNDQQGIVLNVVVGIVGVMSVGLVHLAPGRRRHDQPEQLQHPGTVRLVLRRSRPAGCHESASAWPVRAEQR